MKRLLAIALYVILMLLPAIVVVSLFSLSGCDTAGPPHPVSTGDGDVTGELDGGPAADAAHLAGMDLRESSSDLADTVDLASMADIVVLPDLAPACKGYVDPVIGGCWYVWENGTSTCATVCAKHGGFDAVASQHKGSDILEHFYPQSKPQNTAVGPFEQGGFSNGALVRWPANGMAPDGMQRVAAYFACSCFD